MAFPESVKIEVRHKAAFRCCRCQAIGVEIHHILPQAEGGQDTIDNAAPLCASCHADFGGNPLKRKELRDMRAWWYQRVMSSIFGSNPQFQALEEKLDALVLKHAASESSLDEIKAVLLNYVGLRIDQVEISNVKAVVSSVANTKWGDDPITAEQVEVLRELLDGEFSDSALEGFLIVSPRFVDEFGAPGTRELQGIFKTETAQGRRSLRKSLEHVFASIGGVEDFETRYPVTIIPPRPAFPMFRILGIEKLAESTVPGITF